MGLVTFTATATEGEPSALTIEAIEGDDQTAPAGSAIALDPAVRVLEGGQPSAGVEVTFAVTAGGGRSRVRRRSPTAKGSLAWANGCSASSPGSTGSRLAPTGRREAR